MIYLLDGPTLSCLVYFQEISETNNKVVFRFISLGKFPKMEEDINATSKLWRCIWFGSQVQNSDSMIHGHDTCKFFFFFFCKLPHIKP